MEEDTIELIDYLRVIWKWKWIIIIGTFVCIVATGAVSFLLPKSYQASVTFMVSEPKMAEASNFGNAQYFISYPLQTYLSYPLQTYEGIIKNRLLEAKVIERLKLDLPPYEMTLGDINGTIAVEFLRDSRLIRLKVEFPDPELAQQIANELAILAVDLNKTLTEKESVDYRDFIREQLEEAKLRLDQAEKALLDFQRTAQIESLTKELEIQLALKENFEIELENTETVLEQNKATLQRIEEQFKTQEKTFKLVSNLVEDPAYQQSLATLSKADIKALLGFNMEKEVQNPVYFHLENQLVDVISSIGGLLAKKANLEASLKENVTRLKKLQEELAQKEIELGKLERERELAQATYKMLTLRYDEARIQVISRTQELKIVDPATIPENSIKPKKKLITGIAGIVSFLFLVLASFFINYIKSVNKQH